jgi:putrescine transport system ATP-binding protein
VNATERTSLAAQPWCDPTAVPQIELRDLSKDYDGVVAVRDLNLAIYQREIFAIVGASGCGKTTLLRMLAGFVTPSSGQILLEGTDVSATPPYERPVNMMFQSYALFPHMTVVDNIGYGLRRLDLDEATRKRRIEEALEMVQLGPLRKRKPHQLSGGQRQRVALARALIRRPKLLLLDEPLSALDKKLRESTQFELMDLQHELGITFVVVTHDQDEAMTLASRIAVMDRGAVIQVGTPAEVYEFPRTRFVADFFGNANLFEGTVLSSDAGLVRIHCPELQTDLLVDDRRAEYERGQPTCVAVRPEKMHLEKGPARGVAQNEIDGVVWELGYLGNRSVYQIKTRGGKLVTAFTQNARRTLDWAIDWNDEVHVSWAADAAVIVE